MRRRMQSELYDEDARSAVDGRAPAPQLEAVMQPQNKF